MNSLLITPRDNKELKFLKELFGRLGVRCHVVIIDTSEGDRLVRLMKSADRKKMVMKASILKKLRN